MKKPSYAIRKGTYKGVRCYRAFKRVFYTLDDATEFVFRHAYLDENVLNTLKQLDLEYDKTIKDCKRAYESNTEEKHVRGIQGFDTIAYQSIDD
jgi:hypothetical protein